MPEACQDGLCSTCIGCNSCNSSCQGINSCSVCNTCQNGCDTKQTYCGAGKQTIAGATGNSFEFSPKPAKDVIMGPEEGYFNKDSWDAIATYISTRNTLPVETKTTKPAAVTATTTWVSTNNANGGDKVNASANSAVAPFSAAEFNRIANSLLLAEGTNRPSAVQNAIIYASLFNTLASTASASLIKDDACKKCNAGCDYGCDACQKCNSGCQSCNSCDSCDSGCQGTYTCGVVQTT